MDKIDYYDIENKLIEQRNRLPIVSPKMDNKLIHELSCIKSGFDMAIKHLIELRKLK